MAERCWRGFRPTTSTAERRQAWATRWTAQNAKGYFQSSRACPASPSVTAWSPSREGLSSRRTADPQARRAEWQQLPWYLRLGAPPDFGGAAAGQKAAAYGLWAERVAPGRPWDHKRLLRTKFPGQPHPHWHKYGDFDYFYDIWSNIHYGYGGVALGFGADELINGAGLAQAMDDFVNGRPLKNHPQNGTWPASSDDVPDQISIRLGTDLYLEVKPHSLTIGILLERIVAVPEPWGKGGDMAKEPHDCNRMRE